MEEKFVQGFRDELEKIAKFGLGKKLMLGGAVTGLAGIGVASHAASKGAESGRIQAMEQARRRRQLLGY